CDPHKVHRLTRYCPPAVPVSDQAIEIAEMDTIVVNQIQRPNRANRSAASSTQIAWDPLTIRSVPSLRSLSPRQALSLVAGIAALELADRRPLFVPAAPIRNGVVDLLAGSVARGDRRDDLGFIESNKGENGRWGRTGRLQYQVGAVDREREAGGLRRIE